MHFNFNEAKTMLAAWVACVVTWNHVILVTSLHPKALWRLHLARLQLRFMAEQLYIAIQMAKQKSCMYVARSQFSTNHNKPSNDMRLYNFPPTSQSRCRLSKPPASNTALLLGGEIPGDISRQRLWYSAKVTAINLYFFSKRIKCEVCLLKAPVTTPTIPKMQPML